MFWLFYGFRDLGIGNRRRRSAPRTRRARMVARRFSPGRAPVAADAAVALVYPTSSGAVLAGCTS